MSRTNDGLDMSSTTDGYSGDGYSRQGNRTNDGLDTSNTSDAYSSEGYGRQGNRTNDGLDTSNTSDAYSRGNTGGDYRSNDGLDTANTSDAYGSNAGRVGQSTFGGSSMRGNDGLDASGTTDARGDSGYSRGGDSSYNDRTSGGLGYDDRIGSAQRTGGGQRGGDQELSEGTSGGLGQNDTYGDEGNTGGADTGVDHNYGMGSGRTVEQERGGILPTEPGRVDAEDQRDYDLNRRREPGERLESESSGKDSTMGKLMEKAGSAFKNEGLVAKGQEKRNQAAYE